MVLRAAVTAVTLERRGGCGGSGGGGGGDWSGVGGRHLTYAKTRCCRCGDVDVFPRDRWRRRPQHGYTEDRPHQVTGVADAASCGLGHFTGG